MANAKIGHIGRAKLAAMLPELVEIRRSSRDNCRYPLYLSTPWGPWHMNSAAAQDVLLEHGEFPAPGMPEPEPAPEPAATTTGERTHQGDRLPADDPGATAKQPEETGGDIIDRAFAFLGGD